MSYKIIVDSCGELSEELKADGHFSNVPLELDVDGYQITDDETFDQKDFLQRVKAAIHSPKSSCPSPERYMSACSGTPDQCLCRTGTCTFFDISIFFMGCHHQI